MGPTFVRPRVAELLFRLFDRPLHPELFAAVAAARRVESNGARVTVRITPTGHVLEWTDGTVTLTELTVTSDVELPARGRRLGHRLGGGRGGRCDLGRVRYQVSSQVEVLPPELFVRAHEELRADGARKGLVSHFRGGDRLGLAPLGVVVAEALPGALAVSAFHTFPEERAVVKTQTLIERG